MDHIEHTSANFYKYFYACNLKGGIESHLVLNHKGNLNILLQLDIKCEQLHS